MFTCGRSFLNVFLHFVIFINISVAESQQLKRAFNNSISAIFIFGDSTVDSGNNNYVNTPYKSNFSPYGIDFANRTATGRFSDGKLVTDFIASYLGIKEYVPPYLDSSISLKELMTGVCFASAGSGFDPLTSQLSGVISTPKQLEYFKEYKGKLEAAIGKESTETLIKKAVYVISAGTNDFSLNYFATPIRQQTYNITTYQQFLLKNTQQFIEGLRKEGARVIAIVGLPPIGCLPIVITFTSSQAFSGRPCTDYMSTIALSYNQKLQDMFRSMENSESPIVYADIYQPLSNMVQKPSQFGFEKANAGCCGSGYLETVFMCNPSSAICSNPSKYVFFDSVHPTEVAYSFLFKSLRPIIDQIIMKYGH